VLVSAAKGSTRSAGEAAKAYQAFLREHPKERAAMAEWESAPLGEAVEEGGR
jgi:hypothetical protein